MDLDRDRLQRLAELVQQMDPDLCSTLATLQSDAEHYRDLVESKQIAFAQLSPDFRILHANARLCDLLGYTVEELIGTNLSDRMHPDDTAAALDWTHRIAHYRVPPYAIDLRLQRKDGGCVWTRFSATLTRNADGLPTSWQLGIEDITEQRRLQDNRTSVIESARCLLWHAVVHELGHPGYLGWALTFPPLETAQRFLRLEIDAAHPYSLAFYHARPEEDRLRSDAVGLAAIRANQNYEQEYRVRPADGSLHWIHEAVQVEAIEPGRMWRLVGVCIDITERKRMEEALRASEARLQQALINARQGLWDWDLVSGRVYRDANWGRLLGYRQDEIDDRPELWRDCIHPDDRERVFAILERHLASDEAAYDADYRALHRSGEWIWINTRGSVVSRDQTGKPLRMIGTLQDISARKRAEMATRESEERFRSLINDLPLLIWMLDAENRPSLVNRAWLEFTGYSEEAIPTFDWTAMIHPDDIARAQGAYLAAYQSRSVYQAEYRWRRQDGQYRWLLTVGVPRFHQDGVFVGYIGSSQDITDLRALQNQLIEAQKLESLGRLAGGVAHDFNNLLTAIMGYTELALLSLSADAEETVMLNNVQSAAERAANLTRQLLMYARRQMVEFTTIDLNAVILGTHDLLRRTIGEQYELVILPMEDTCCVTANTTQIEQVLLNLVVNARDAMPEGGRILIETTTVVLDNDYASRHLGVKPGEYVMLSVSDTGAGMTAEIRDRIFEPFFTTKAVGKGTGLGMATCYGIVKQSKGDILVYSEPGLGTVVKVYLPRVTTASAAPQQTAPLQSEQAGTETILLVDDEPMVRDAAARILRQYGYAVLEASNGPEALNLLAGREGAIDLLLTDVVMPLMGGKELAQRLQQSLPQLRVLYMSGYTQNAMMQSGVLKPGTALLSKPFSAASLIQKIREALSGP